MKIELNEGAAWSLVVMTAGAILITLVVTVNGYYRARDIAAIQKGLCEDVVQARTVWTPCKQ